MVGIIANPSSGKDIRRLVAQGAVFDNMEKVNIIQRIMISLHRAGVSDIRMMPDSFGILEKALLAVERGLKIKMQAKPLDMHCEYDQNDTVHAAELLRKEGASCIITLGGDGTNRAVAKGCGNVPLIPISTGTNNVFPMMMEGTVAGMAAAVVDKMPEYMVLRRCKKLHIFKNNQEVDIALVDVVTTDDLFIGSRAIWDYTNIRELFVTTARADSIGMSAIAGSFHPLSADDPDGLYICVAGSPMFETTAPIAPGVLATVPISSHVRVPSGSKIRAIAAAGMVALDGEREISFNAEDVLEVLFDTNGPLVVEIAQTLEMAAKQNYFVHL
jgi:predicted polyphosphate/ATP-dependent NAD kinase